MAKVAVSRAVKVFRAEGGLSVLTRVTVEQAVARKDAGIYREEFDNLTGELLGYRLIGADLRKVDADVKSVRLSCTITAWEMLLNCSRSRTRGLSEERRLERLKAGNAPEDVVERVQAKVRVYAVIGSARGDILRVWPK